MTISKGESMLGNRALLSLVLLLGACGADDAAASMEAAEDFCVWVTHQRAGCAGIDDAAQIDMYVIECGEKYGRLPPALLDAVRDCVEVRACDEPTRDLDDVCFEPALDSLRGTLLTSDTFEACKSSDECKQRAIGGQLLDPGVVGDCLRRWGACSSEQTNEGVFWTEDHCITLIALQEDARTEAGDCLARPCVEIAQCLKGAGAFNY